MAAKYVSINNELVLAADAKVGVGDLAMHRGYGIFDYFKVVDGRPVFMEDHFNRFYNSAKEMHLEATLNRDELRKTIAELMEKNNMPNSGIKLLLTGGYSEDGYKMGKPNLIILQYPLSFKEGNQVETGLKLATVNHQRQLPSIKTIDYLMAVRLHPFMKENGFDDVLYHNNGTITECPRANFWIVSGNEIITAANNILRGITRSKVLNFKVDGYTILERDFTLNDLANVQEAFITSTTQYAYPVAAIDGKEIGDRKIGPVTRQVKEQLLQLICDSN
ncbi:aminotransferase class IV [Mucilaginibacter flavidus]|uniref:aminotransferase class IV n=1 Tax=Mucilaginibacter flavidus TaxID=2949309 RepID=UPI002093B09C|nr:aminotransferase class IV [Mucilaginibacter flavidus]MCO5947087.1 aminotransferase class IV [Mucilaginibacter flavidus]